MPYLAHRKDDGGTGTSRAYAARVATDVFLVRGAANAKHRQMTRAERRRVRDPGEPLASLSAPAAATLEAVTENDDLVVGLPLLMGWKAFGAIHEVRGEALHDLARDLVHLDVRAGSSAEVARTVAELETLVQRAIAKDLALLVVPD